jgi:hypothetical protein
MSKLGSAEKEQKPATHKAAQSHYKSWNEIHGNDPFADDITQILFKSWDELFGMERAEVEEFQLRSVRQRLEKLAPRVKALSSQMENSGTTAINTLNDVVPLLFSHTAYKSYPISIVENGRFDRLTQWLSGMTSLDLSGVDATKCTGIDDWFSLLERTTPLMPYHTSGTTGKFSVYPRTSFEADLWGYHHLKRYEGFGDEPAVKLGFNHLRLPHVSPNPRYGRYTAQRLLKFMAEHLAPTPEQCYAGTEATLSADLVMLSGRIRMAQAKGELSNLKLSDSMRIAFKRYLEELENRPAQMAAFMYTIVDKLRGKRISIDGNPRLLLPVAQEAAKRGIFNVFAPDGVMGSGGGGKGIVLPAGWFEQMKAFTGIKHSIRAYGMTEITGTMRACPTGYFHIPPFFIPYLLDPHTGAVLPRSGTQTGRFACMDLLPTTYWGGIISGDKVTIEWDRTCPCGRKGAHIHDNVSRYSEEVTGDDKITCAATVDNTDAALQQLINL